MSGNPPTEKVRGFRIVSTEARRDEQRIEESLNRRVALEKMLAEISGRAVSVEDMQEFLRLSLRTLGQTLDVSRVYIFTRLDDADAFRLACEWTARGVTSGIDLDHETLILPWIADQLKKRKIVNLSNSLQVATEHERKIVREEEIKSLLIVPLSVRHEFHGFMGFDECRFHRRWAEEDLYILRTAAQIISRAMEGAQDKEQILKHGAHLEAIFRSVQDAIITVDPAGIVTAANPSAELVCGLPPRDIVGRPFTGFPRHCDQSCQSVLAETLKTRAAIQERQVECRCRPDDRQTVVVSSSPLAGPKGDFLGAVLVIRDVSRLVYLENELKERSRYQEIVGKSHKMQEIYTFLHRLADIDTTVLITGESGTGKEMVARALHAKSVRAGAPFVAVNCSALAENLLESELFGHVKGAFTGASRDKLGRFEAANRGTILLDEIGDISPLVQLKLLRVIQEKEIERVGESISRRVDVRMIATTNCDLKEKIRTGEFRNDLYYRLKVVEIHLPPLRERCEDIPFLVGHFCELFSKTFRKETVGVSDEVLKAFMDYPWPGNVRELKHTIERAIIVTSGKTLRMDDLPLEIREHAGSPGHGHPKSSGGGPQEILGMLERSGGNRAKAARLLGISRQTLYRKIRRYNIGRA
ncbi:MAG: sigma 54-interacting transcriptional regulator [bacterium]